MSLANIKIGINTMFKKRTGIAKAFGACGIFALGIFCIFAFWKNTKPCFLISLLSPDNGLNIDQVFSICIIKSSHTANNFDTYYTKEEADISNFLTSISESVVSFDGNSEAIKYNNNNLYDITITLRNEETIDFAFSDLGKIYYQNKRYDLKNDSLQLFSSEIFSTTT